MSGLSGRLALRKPPPGAPLQQVSDDQIEQAVFHLGSKPAGVSFVLAGAPPAAALAAPLQQAGSSGKKRKAEELLPAKAAPAPAAQAAAAKGKSEQGGGSSRRAAAGKKPAAAADSGDSWSSGDEEEASKGALQTAAAGRLSMKSCRRRQRADTLSWVLPHLHAACQPGLLTAHLTVGAGGCWCRRSAVRN
jgi:hypothetical protein